MECINPELFTKFSALILYMYTNINFEILSNCYYGSRNGLHEEKFLGCELESDLLEKFLLWVDLLENGYIGRFLLWLTEKLLFSWGSGSSILFALLEIQYIHVRDLLLRLEGLLFLQGSGLGTDIFGKIVFLVYFFAVSLSWLMWEQLFYLHIQTF